MEGERYRTGLAAETTPLPQATSAASDETSLVRQFRERLRLFAFRRLHDSAGAEDVAQETLRRVLEACRAGKLENPAALPAFVFQTAQHICLQQFRSHSREGRALLRLSGERPSPPESHPLVSLIGEERREAVRCALAELSQEDRELLRMLYYEEAETGALARKMGLTPGALRVRKHRVLARLAALLNGREI